MRKHLFSTRRVEICFLFFTFLMNSHTSTLLLLVLLPPKRTSWRETRIRRQGIFIMMITITRLLNCCLIIVEKGTFFDVVLFITILSMAHAYYPPTFPFFKLLLGAHRRYQNPNFRHSSKPPHATRMA